MLTQLLVNKLVYYDLASHLVATLFTREKPAPKEDLKKPAIPAFCFLTLFREIVRLRVQYSVQCTFIIHAHINPGFKVMNMYLTH